MKIRSILTVFIIISIITGCQINDPVSSDDPQNIRGSDSLITEIRDLPQFHSISQNTVGDVYITYGEEQKVEVTVNVNYIDYVKTSVSNGCLNISLESHNSFSNLNLKIDVTMTDVYALTTISAGNIHGKNRFVADEVTLATASAGNISLALDAEELFSTIGSAGNLNLSGKVGTHHALLLSAGNLNASSLETKTTSISINSAGNAFIYVTDYLEARLNSVGNLYFKGNPTIESYLTSIGRIYNIN